MLAAAVAGCSSSTAPDGTAAAPVPTATVVVEPATVLPEVGNPTNLTVKPAIAAGVGVPPAELTVKDLVVGQGALASASSTVVVNYVGALWNTGAQFDASWDSGVPAEFPLTQVITGFGLGIGGSAEDAIEGMRVGGRRLIVIPPALGYGPVGGRGDIKVDDTIVFVVDLLDVDGSVSGGAASPEATSPVTSSPVTSSPGATSPATDPTATR
ncbi:FKBP-type peptidyl-prolyl cis-trans isomerase [Frankia sp. CNm7]|uniref:Peptidyl-prolyl cis-trans isomerase n=1 Tax=Frankia nepalensis TaxID=1836974 RepID=A0A937RKR0_9ACTN|nr:FKBP-type peptidyl-prolyl cis-trans isomerase [Frankia nepalensis]MBL7511738.1 FKBP-type peptidyl-prolyl cis-trans isomerase [Frankia nepalensis]MBL7524736.1 FKBP-type peptidyl-prolyl cis-trans isomerase [Frankia nepalensis]MBL7629124.1 FKBP-type peptidyl-prolyl cis-trans isomerase [Frankia nepalensis]